jgi:hypothetical protein
MSDGDVRENGGERSIVRDVILYVGAILVLLGFGTLYFDDRYNASTNRTLGIALVVLAGVAFGAWLATHRDH